MISKVCTLKMPAGIMIKSHQLIITGMLFAFYLCSGIVIFVSIMGTGESCVTMKGSSTIKDLWGEVLV